MKKSKFIILIILILAFGLSVTTSFAQKLPDILGKADKTATELGKKAGDALFKLGQNIANTNPNEVLPLDRIEGFGDGNGVTPVKVVEVAAPNTSKLALAQYQSLDGKKWLTLFARTAQGSVIFWASVTDKQPNTTAIFALTQQPDSLAIFGDKIGSVLFRDVKKKGGHIEGAGITLMFAPPAEKTKATAAPKPVGAPKPANAGAPKPANAGAPKPAATVTDTLTKTTLAPQVKVEIKTLDSVEVKFANRTVVFVSKDKKPTASTKDYKVYMLEEKPDNSGLPGSTLYLKIEEHQMTLTIGGFKSNFPRMVRANDFPTSTENGVISATFFQKK